MSKHFAFIPITGLALLTIAGCGTPPSNVANSTATFKAYHLSTKKPDIC